MNYENTQALILELCKAQLERYPATQAADLMKMLFQGEFGPGHLISDAARSKRFLAQEYADIQNSDYNSKPEPIEPIGFGFVRLHLSAVDALGLSPDTFHRIFELSALSQYGTRTGFAHKVSALKELCRQGALPFDENEIDGLYNESPALFRHSEAFRRAHRPAYRVVKEEYCRHIGLLTKIDAAFEQNQPVTVAIDGDAASGKTTLGGILRLIYNCTLIHTDHFFLQQHQRTKERLAQPGGNVDYERFKTEVLTPILAREHFAYRPFDCQTWDFGEEIAVPPNRLNVIEGCYSHHPALGDAYNIKVFLKVGPEEQMRRIALRNVPALVEKFRDIWIPMEKKYFAAFDIEGNSDLVFSS
jgi:uridine kinase